MATHSRQISQFSLVQVRHRRQEARAHRPAMALPQNRYAFFFFFFLTLNRAVATPNGAPSRTTYLKSSNFQLLTKLSKNPLRHLEIVSMMHQTTPVIPYSTYPFLRGNTNIVNSGADGAGMAHFSELPEVIPGEIVVPGVSHSPKSYLKTSRNIQNGMKHF